MTVFKNLSWRTLSLIAMAATLSSCKTITTSPTLRERISLDADWRFQKGDPADVAPDALSYNKIKDWVEASGSDLSQDPYAEPRPQGSPGGDQIACTQSNFDDSHWRLLNLPHDWGIEGPFRQEYASATGKLPYWGVGWYRKHINISPRDKGRQIYLDVDGAMSYATVWVNGKFAGGWPYGYSSFRVNLTPYLNFGGDNLLAIRLDNPPDSSRWYPGGGIYRNVWLVKTAPVHVAHWGTYVTTPKVSRDAATVNLRVNIENNSTADANVLIKTELCELDANGHPGQHVASLPTQTIKIPAGQKRTVEANAAVARPKLWNLQTHRRYVAVTSVEQNGHLVDNYQTPFGIRTIKFTAKEGFFLNGQLTKIKGVCDHHDLGALGAALNLRALQRQIELLQGMGCNAIRTSHNPPAPELLDLCDRMGMLVMDESFDCWKKAKKPNDYSRLFDDWHEKDLRAMLRRDRNHPCIILWSIGNEIPEQTSRSGKTIAASLARIVHQEDPTRPVTSACNRIQSSTNGFQHALDVYGGNYKSDFYDDIRKANPNLPVYGSETSSCVSSRGEYFFPVSDDKSLGKENFQVSSYDLYAPRWAVPPDAEFKGQDENPFVAGEFVWTGFDYIGEPTPYNDDSSNMLNMSDPVERARLEKELQDLGKIRVPSRSSYFGIMDLAGFPKDRYYIYQARWRPDLPMAHILPHWNWPERVGQVTPVHVYTSGDEAELFLNGHSLGRKHKGALEYRLRWDDVIYQPGELKVVAYKNGHKWAEDVVKTTGSPAQITLKPDRDVLSADGRDLAFVTVAVVDKNGLMVPRSKNLLQFEVSGPAEIIATDNGDATSHESFQSKQRNVFNGLCLVVLRTKPGEPGRITLKATGEGLAAAQTTLRSRR